MKTKTLLIVHAFIAISGALTIYLLKDDWTTALLFAAFVWGVYERITKEIVKTDFKKANIISYSTWKKTVK